MFNKLFDSLTVLQSIKERSSAGKNATPARLIRQALPYYFNKSGFSFKPLSIFVIINSRCNMACRFCDVGQDAKSSMFYKNMINGDLDFDLFLRLIEDVKPFKPFISITSTEPLLYPFIDDAVSFVKKQGMEINITTNGYLLERHAEKFVKYGLDKLTISVDGPAHIHDAIRKMPGAFEKIMKGMDIISDLKQKSGLDKPSILINSTICDLNHRYLEELFESLPMDKIKRVGLMPMVFLTEEIATKHNFSFGNDYPATATCLYGGANLSQIDTDRIFDSVKKLKIKYKGKLHLYFRNDKEYLRKFFKEPETFLEKKRCLFPWFAAQINTKGDLLGLTRCYDSTYGNVFDSGFCVAWNGPKMRKFRRDLLHYKAFTACSRCEGTLVA